MLAANSTPFVNQKRSKLSQSCKIDLNIAQFLSWVYQDRIAVDMFKP